MLRLAINMSIAAAKQLNLLRSSTCSTAATAAWFTSACSMESAVTVNPAAVSLVGWRPFHTMQAVNNGSFASRSQGTLHHDNRSAVLPTAHSLATQSTKADDFDLFSAEPGLVSIDGYTGTGFILGETKVEGPLLCLRDSFYLWDVDSLASATAAAPPTVMLMNPPPEVMVFGTGSKLQPLPADFVRQVAARGIGLESADTLNAMATFNILAQEGRHVVGVLLPVSI